MLFPAVFHIAVVQPSLTALHPSAPRAAAPRMIGPQPYRSAEERRMAREDARRGMVPGFRGPQPRPGPRGRGRGMPQGPPPDFYEPPPRYVPGPRGPAAGMPGRGQAGGPMPGRGPAARDREYDTFSQQPPGPQAGPRRSYRQPPPVDAERRHKSPGLRNNFYDLPTADFKRPHGVPPPDPPPPAAEGGAAGSGQPAGSGYQAEPHWEKSSFGQQSSYTQSGAGYGQPSAGYGRASDEVPLPGREKEYEDHLAGQVVDAQGESVERLEGMGARVALPPEAGGDEEEEEDITWDALAGAEETRLQVEEALLLPLQHPEAFAAVRAGTRTLTTKGDRAGTLLFYGPPGTGKTTAARIAAASAGLPLVYVPLEALMSKWYGKAEQQLAALFDECGRLGRCVLFLDELDALAGSRSREMHEASRRMLSVLLRRLDGMDAQADTTLIAATNRRTDLDSALLSRFDVRVHFAAPEAAGRSQIFGLYAKHLAAAELSRLGDAAVGLSGRDILDVCRQAERRWVCTRLRSKASTDELPPLEQYEEALRRRLETSGEREDGAGGAGRPPQRPPFAGPGGVGLGPGGLSTPN
mmetsp:Transcript_12174/g.35925  ORF Transcript_12174/g.35925 Transcript_12174/m.35925 type:complete len:582 (-) Transcript_12174:372-2117(-)